MIYRIRQYQITPEKLSIFNQLFYEYLLPNQTLNGAELVGRFVNENHTKIIAIWLYPSIEDYEKIESIIKKSNLHLLAEQFRKLHDPLYLSTKQSFWTNTFDLYKELNNV